MLVKNSLKWLIPLMILFSSCHEKAKVFSNHEEIVRVTKGDEFVLKIQSNHSTGYQWMEMLAIDTNLLLLKFVDYKIDNPKIDGGGGYEFWYFVAKNSGETAVKLKYQRPWESDPPADTLEFRIHIGME